MQITATQINYYIVCQRKLWLYTNGINMEHTSDIVADGKLLHEISYPQRAERSEEVGISASYNGIDLTGKIDFYDAKLKVIHEIKRSDKIEDAHEWQVKYYIWLLELNGIEGVQAILEYPTLRHKSLVVLNEMDKQHLSGIIATIAQLKTSGVCPHKINAKICKSCSYYELCYVEE